MRKNFLIPVTTLLLCLIVSCAKDDERPLPDSPDIPMQAAYIADSTYNAASQMTVYNIVYPSTDPYGNPVMLSGTITFGNNVKQSRHAKGMLLYNHFTIYRADQCPTKGSLAEQQYTSRLDLFTVSPDYYGFGITENHHQAYCLSRTNAQASVDALLAAREILASKGYSFGDILLNAGYSQGGQTSMGVVRLIAEKYPDLHLTYTFAGAGSYDLPETYRQFITAQVAGMPSTVISVLLSYNEFYQMGVPRDKMFIEPVLSHIDEWILSKRYTRVEIDNLVGTLAIDHYLSPTLLDTNSTLSHQLFSTLDQDNICKGWNPSHSAHILLFHNNDDITVPPSNTVNMYNFLVNGGAQDVVLDTASLGSGVSGEPAHEHGALTFLSHALSRVNQILQ